MYKTKANLKEDVYHLIRNDIPLREKISAQIGITVDSVYRHAFRKSPTLSKPIVIEVIAKHLSKDISELTIQNEEVRHGQE